MFARSIREGITASNPGWLLSGWQIACRKTANGILTAILLIPCSIFIVFLERFISVPAHLVLDVKILFALVFAGFFITLLTSLFNVAVFVENKLYLNAQHSAEGSVIRLVMTLMLFKLFPAKIAFVGATTLVLQLYDIAWKYHYSGDSCPKCVTAGRKAGRCYYFSL